MAAQELLTNITEWVATLPQNATHLEVYPNLSVYSLEKNTVTLHLFDDAYITLYHKDGVEAAMKKFLLRTKYPTHVAWCPPGSIKNYRRIASI